MLDPVKNFAKVTVSTGYDNLATSIVLSSGHGAKLPDPATDGSFNLVWWNSTDFSDPADDSNNEIVRCTARSTDTLTITRAQEGTSATNKNTGGKTYKMILAPTKKLRDDVQTRIRFGGDGSDGALNVTSGTTTIDLTTQKVVEKNYSSINVSSGATLAFSNPNSVGTVVILRSRGNVTIAGTVSANFGSAGGAAVAGGPSASVGNTGSVSDAILDDDGSHGGFGGGFGTACSGGNCSAGAGGTIFNKTTLAARSTPYSTVTTNFYRKMIMVIPGAGGASGGACGGSGDFSGAGGRGGGALIIEAGGDWNFTGTISVAGNNGANSGMGGGGGGGGGMLVALYTNLIASSGTASASGGTGGSGSCGATGGGGGGGGASILNNGASGSGATGGTGGAGSTVVAKNIWF